MPDVPGHIPLGGASGDATLAREYPGGACHKQRSANKWATTRKKTRAADGCPRGNIYGRHAAHVRDAMMRLLTAGATIALTLATSQDPITLFSEGETGVWKVTDDTNWIFGPITDFTLTGCAQHCLGVTVVSCTGFHFRVTSTSTVCLAYKGTRAPNSPLSIVGTHSEFT